MQLLIPSGLLLHSGCPKYSTVQPAVQLLAKNSPKTRLQHYLAWCGQDLMAQTKPHSQPHAIGVKYLQTFALSQALLDVPCQSWQPNQEPILLSLPILQPSGTHPTLSWWIQACASFPAKVAICCRRVLGCHPLLGCIERGAGQDVIPPIV